MAKITRKTLLQFGVSGPSTSFGQFGSKVAGVPQTTQDPTVIQQLAAWVNGWQNAVVTANKAAYLEDMNGWCYVHSYMSAYILQQGIPEWDTGTTYYTNSVVQGTAALGNAGQWFNSLQDSNAGNAPPVGASNAFWTWINSPPPAVPLVGNALKANLIVKPNVGAPLTKTDASADLLSVQGVVLSSVAVTGDISVSGANGLDTGSPSNSTWYAFHVITNAAGSLVASLYSLSATAPVLPGGYTLFRRVGWVRRNGSGSFFKFRTAGNMVYWDDATVFAYLSPSGTTSFADSIPPTSTEALFWTDILTSNASNHDLSYIPTGSSSPLIYINSARSFSGGTAAAVQATMRSDTSQQMDITCTGSSWTLTSVAYTDLV